jgi:hypothetical protein
LSRLFFLRVSGYPGQFNIVNILSICECLDETSSEILTWKHEDGEPAKVGRYRAVYVLKIDPKRAERLDLFRVAGWDVAVIVSDRLKSAFERDRVSGVHFLPVT